jgi:hypothetical protein
LVSSLSGTVKSVGTNGFADWGMALGVKHIKRVTQGNNCINAFPNECMCSSYLKTQ